MKILFLDIDGVLNSRAWAERHGDGWNRRLDPLALEQLQRVIYAVPDLKIVASSSWRIGKTHSGLRGALIESGMSPRITNLIVDHTPSLPFPRHRGDEIGAWLNGVGPAFASHFGPPLHFAIVDDGDDMGDHKDRLVQTRWEDGLTAADADKLIGLLS